MFPYEVEDFFFSFCEELCLNYISSILHEKTFNQNTLALSVLFKVDVCVTDIPIVCENNETIRPTLVLYNIYQNNKHVLVFS